MAAVDAESGRKALSVAHVLATDGRLSLLAVRIGTGRTHQIRVHLQQLRCPVLGDPLYGDLSVNKREAKRAPRPLLHAYRLTVERPPGPRGQPPDGDGGLLTVQAPPPDDLASVACTLAGCEREGLEAWLDEKLGPALASSDAEFAERVREAGL